MTTLFLVGVTTLFYIYAGYPLLLYLVVRLRGPRPVRRVEPDRDRCPRVSFVISAYNEGDVLRDKLKNALALDYPADRLEIVVVSDASSDATDDIVREFSPRVRLARQEQHLGKTAGLNGVMPTLKSDVVVFSDANAMYLPDAVRKLVRNFGDPEVGCVTGESRYVGGEHTGAGAGELVYWSYEMRIKGLETAVGSMVGGDGAIYAIRRQLWTALPETAINDFLNPLQIVAAGWRAVYESEAVCHEAPAGSAKKEYRRRVRIVSRSWRAVFQAVAVLNPCRVGFFAVSVLSHKVMRWLAGVFIVLSGASLLAMMTAADGLLALVPVGVWALLGFAVVSYWALSRFGALASYFLVLQLASLVGVVSGTLGRVSATWAPPRESEVSRRSFVHGLLPEPALVRLSVVLGAAVVAYGVWFRSEPRMATLTLFWGATVCFGYVYAGYPLVLGILAWLVPRPVRSEESHPSVCLFITANDEAVVIEQKIRNSLALDYPPERLRIVVASDGSVDGTNEIVESFADAGVRLLAFPTRRGKIAAINDGVPLVDTEILVFSDANTFLAADALSQLVQPFTDARVGGVSGNVILVGDRASLALAEDLYYRYERWLQSSESKIGSMVGADGALYAIRRQLFRPPPDDTILDDVAIPMAVVRQGYRVVLAPHASAWEPGTRSASDELLRKSRVVAGAVLMVARGAQLPTRPRQILFSLISHKVLRWLTPAFVLATFVGSLLLAPTGWIYQLVAGVHVIAVVLGLLGCAKVLRRFSVLGIANYFLLVQVAAGVGLLRGLSGGQAVAWRRFSRTPLSGGQLDGPAVISPRDASTVAPAAARWLLKSGTMSLIRKARPNRGLAILRYHAVCGAEGHSYADPTLCVTPDAFATHVRYLVDNYRIVSLPEAASRLRRGKRLPPNAVALTFDDGYGDNLAAARVLAGVGVTGTFYVTAGSVGGEQPFWPTELRQLVDVAAEPKVSLELDVGSFELTCRTADERDSTVAALTHLWQSVPIRIREQARRQLRMWAGQPLLPQVMLTWDQLAEMRRLGMTIGAKTLTQPHLPSVEPHDVRREIEGSKRRVELELGVPVTMFAYPTCNTGHDVTPHIRQVVGNAGFLAASTTRHGFVTSASDLLALDRVHAPERVEDLVFALEVERLRWQPGRQVPVFA